MSSTKLCKICQKEFKPQERHGEHRQCCYTCIPDTCRSQHERISAKSRAIRKEGVRILGGRCWKCGETRHYLLEFHHIIPKHKRYTLSQLMSKGKIEEYFIEIQKCILLCANCHKEFHYLRNTTHIETGDYVDLTKFHPKFHHTA